MKTTEEVMRAPWELSDGTIIHLITPKELAMIPDGEVLWCIDGTAAEKGVDRIDDDTRGGMLAYGLRADHEKCQLAYLTTVTWGE